jgi:metallo-beta-lactamase family protein
MQITFYGATREVTGSMHLITTEKDRILLDCGLFQGRRKESDLKNRVFPFDPSILTSVILSHAHIDHAGRIPLLVKKGFTGRVLSTRATAGACSYLLPDSAQIQESDAAYLNYKTVRSALSRSRTSPGGRFVGKKESEVIRRLLKKNGARIDNDTVENFLASFHLEAVRPLYTLQDAEEALGQFESYPYRHPFSIADGAGCTFYDAGHILGSSFSMLDIPFNGETRKICYTGDIGRPGKPILEDPTREFAEKDRRVDLLIIESTYGGRFHEPVEDLKPRLKEVILETIARGGTLLIPSFAFGRAQELIYMLHELYADKAVPRLPVYIDSPLASKLTRVFGEHPELYDAESHHDFLQKGKNPFFFDKIDFVSSVEESMALMRDDTPHIVIASAGMCEAGRILHHLRYKIHNPKNTILIVGYMAENTLGRRILEGGTAYEAGGRKGNPPLMRILNKEYPLNAQVSHIDGFSAHADQRELIAFLKESNLDVARIAVVHGEEDQSLALAERLHREGYSAVVPKNGESIFIR